MEKIKTFAQDRPFLFGIVLMVLYAVLSTLFYPVHFLFPEDEVGMLYGDTVAKFLIFLVFLAVLWRFGWISRSGITRLGNIRIWPVVVGLLIYRVLVEIYAFTGSISIPLSNPQLAAANLVFSFSTSLVEETMVRGLVLIAMLLAWGSTKGGQLKAILLSSVLFGLVHLFNIFVRPLGVVLVQALILTLPGIFYAALVLTYRSLWPAIMIHWLGNAAVNIKLIGNENYQETLAMWMLNAILFIPIVALSAYLIRRLTQMNGTMSARTDKSVMAQKESVPS